MNDDALLNLFITEAAEALGVSIDEAVRIVYKSDVCRRLCDGLGGYYDYASGDLVAELLKELSE